VLIADELASGVVAEAPVAVFSFGGPCPRAGHHNVVAGAALTVHTGRAVDEDGDGRCSQCLGRCEECSVFASLPKANKKWSTGTKHPLEEEYVSYNVYLAPILGYGASLWSQPNSWYLLESA
jgi:hypothetical protein